MATIGTVEGYLVLTDQFTAVLDRAMTALQKSSQMMNTNLAQMNAALDATSKAHKRMGESAKKAGDDTVAAAAKATKSKGAWDQLKGSVASIRADFAMAAFALYGLTSQVVAAQQATDRMRNALLAGTVDINKVGQELAFVRGEADRLGLNFANSGVQFGKLAAAARGTGVSMNTLHSIFSAIAEASTALGLSAEDSQGALNAIVQMIAKGSVQAEELRGQLGDRLPVAVNAMARALGVGTGELMKMLEQGKVLADDATLSRFAEEIKSAVGPGVVSGAQSFNAELNRLKNSLYDMFSTIAESSALADLTAGMRDLVSVINELLTKGGGAELFNNLSTAITGALGSLGLLIKLYSEFKALVDAGVGAGGSGLTSDDFTPLGFAANAVDRLKEQFAQSKVEVSGWAETFRSALGLAGHSAFELSKAYAEVAKEKDKAFVGPPAPDTAQSIASQKANVKDFQEALARLTKDTVAYQKANEAALNLEKKLQNQAQELEVFNELLAENGGDFDLAKRQANSYYQVLKAGLNPLIGWGKKLYDIARANDAVAEAQSDAEKAQKEQLKGVAHMDALMDKYDEKQRKRREAEEKAMKKAEDNLEANLAKLKKTVDAELGLARASNTSAEAARDMAAELETAIKINSLIPAKIKEGTAEYEEAATRIRAILEPLQAYERRVAHITEQSEKWADVLKGTDFGSDKFNAMASSIGDVILALGKLRTATSLTSDQALAAWGSMLQGIQSVLAATGAFQTGNGGFGGSPEGNYAAEGQMVGAIIGGIIGAMAGGQVQAGMAIGSAAGGILGGFIKKGAEEALASLTIDTSTFTVGISKAEGALGQSINQLGNSIATSVMDIVASIGGTISSLPQVDMKIRDGVIGVVVGGVKAKFKEMDDAISFAVAELLKQGDIIGVDAMIMSALRGTTSSSLEGLSRDLEAVMKVLSFGMTESQQAIQGFTNEMDGLRAQMTRIIGDSDQLARALNNISTEEINRWQRLRDQITGDKQTNAEKLEMLKRDGEMWNAEKALRIAELMQRKSDLEVKLQLLQADAKHLQAYTEIGNFKYEFDLWKLQAEQKLLDTTGEMYRAEIEARSAYLQTSMDLIQVQLAALDQVITALQNMPDIDIPSLRLPNVGNVGSVGSAPTGPSPEELIAQDIENLYEQLHGIFQSLGSDDYFIALERLKNAMYEQIQLAHGDADALAMINQAFEAQIAALEHDALVSLGLESVALNDRMDQLAATLEFLRSQGAITEEQLKELGDSMFADVLGQMAQAIGDSKTLAMLEEIRYDAMKFNARVEIERLAAMGAINKEQYEFLLDYLNNLPDNLPENAGSGSGNGYGDGTPSSTSNSNDALRNAIERLRAAFETYTQFLKSLEVSDLSGGTLAQRESAAMQQYLDTLALAQAGNLDAIDALPGMAQQWLQLAGDLFDPASTWYQTILAMVQGDMGAIRDIIGGTLDAVPATMDDVVDELQTIAEILQAIANAGSTTPITGGGNGNNPNNPNSGTVYFGPEWGWHPPGWAPSGGFGNSPFAGDSNSAGSRTATFESPRLEARLAKIESHLDVSNDLVRKQTAKLSDEIGKPRFSGAKGWTGPVSDSVVTG